jgi:hypothetical protein
MRVWVVKAMRQSQAPEWTLVSINLTPEGADKACRAFFDTVKDPEHVIIILVKERDLDL